MDKFSYAIGLGIGQNLLGMGAKGIAVEDFAQAIKDVLEGNPTAISHQEAREIVNKYFEELEQKMNAASIEQGKAFLEENKKRAGIVTLPSGLRPTGCIRRQSGNSGMGRSPAIDARRFQMEAVYSFRPGLWRTRCRRNDSPA